MCKGAVLCMTPLCLQGFTSASSADSSERRLAEKTEDTRMTPISSWVTVVITEPMDTSSVACLVVLKGVTPAPCILSTACSRTAQSACRMLSRWACASSLEASEEPPPGSALTLAWKLTCSIQVSEQQCSRVRSSAAASVSIYECQLDSSHC